MTGGARNRLRLERAVVHANHADTIKELYAQR